MQIMLTIFNSKIYLTWCIFIFDPFETFVCIHLYINIDWSVDLLDIPLYSLCEKNHNPIKIRFPHLLPIFFQLFTSRRHVGDIKTLGLSGSHLYWSCPPHIYIYIQKYVCIAHGERYINIVQISRTKLILCKYYVPN